MSKLSKSHCNACGLSTNHSVLFEKEIPGADSDGTQSNDRYIVLMCCGCDAVTMQHISYFSDNPGNLESAEITEDFYPPRIARRAPGWATPVLQLFDIELDEDSLPAAVRYVMQEVYAAIQTRSFRLAAMGIRAALECIMVHKIGDQGSFKKNMMKLQEKGYLSNKQYFSLETVLEAGHATIHRGFAPSEDDITVLLDITESLIETAYFHEYRTEKIEKKLPKRPPRQTR